MKDMCNKGGIVTWVKGWRQEKYTPWSQIRRINIAKMIVFSAIIYRFNFIPPRYQNCSHRNKNFPKFIWNQKKTQISQGGNGRHHSPEFKTYWTKHEKGLPASLPACQPPGLTNSDALPAWIQHLVWVGPPQYLSMSFFLQSQSHGVSTALKNSRVSKENLSSGPVFMVRDTNLEPDPVNICIESYLGNIHVCMYVCAYICICMPCDTLQLPIPLQQMNVQEEVGEMEKWNSACTVERG